MLGIFKSMLIWQRRKLCEPSKQGLGTISPAWICAAWLNRGWPNRCFQQPLGTAFSGIRLGGVVFIKRPAAFKGVQQHRGICKVQDTEPNGLCLKSGVLYKVGKILLDHSGSVTKSYCFLSPWPAFLCLQPTSPMSIWPSYTLVFSLPLASSCSNPGFTLLSDA